MQILSSAFEIEAVTFNLYTVTIRFKDGKVFVCSIQYLRLLLDYDEELKRGISHERR